jgi:ubiquinone/menaquinone biosynthesis C-methylase UbiE
VESSYWNAFYDKQQLDLLAPSSFALACLERLSKGARLLELGCGNGRDALFFADRGLRVIACDQSDVAVSALSRQVAEARHFDHRPQFVAGDFTRLPEDWAGTLDVVYSRFTLHAITREECSRALGWAKRALRPGGELFIEARSVKGSLYGKGQPVEGERDAFIYDGHYRRFLRIEELLSEVQGLGFAVTQVTESAGLAVYKDDDPVVIRLVATR